MEEATALGAGLPRAANSPLFGAFRAALPGLRPACRSDHLGRPLGRARATALRGERRDHRGRDHPWRRRAHGARQCHPLRPAAPAEASPSGSISTCASPTWTATAPSPQRLQPHGIRSENPVPVVRTADDVARHERPLRPIYSALIVKPGTPGPGGTTLYGFTENPATSTRCSPSPSRPGKDAVRGPLPERAECGGIAGALRARHPGRDSLSLTYRFPRKSLGDWQALDAGRSPRPRRGAYLKRRVL